MKLRIFHNETVGWRIVLRIHRRWWHTPTAVAGHQLIAGHEIVGRPAPERRPISRHRLVGGCRRRRRRVRRHQRRGVRAGVVVRRARMGYRRRGHWSSAADVLIDVGAGRWVLPRCVGHCLLLAFLVSL
uniref:Uncharacterized protein n=1 Tax=Romanomermis culicivorax TaxID=13658 RepID=A0A915J6V0_ROMCU